MTAWLDDCEREAPTDPVLRDRWRRLLAVARAAEALAAAWEADCELHIFAQPGCSACSRESVAANALRAALAWSRDDAR